MFDLTMHSTHFIYVCMTSSMLKDHSDRERGNLPPLPITPKGSLYAPPHRQDSTFVTPVMESWLEQEIA